MKLLTCVRCNAEKVESDFYRNKGMLMRRCKECAKQGVRDSLRRRAVGLIPTEREPFSRAQRAEITQEAVAALLDYNQATGDLRRRHSCGGAVTGQIAGTISQKGYRRISVNGRVVQAHSLIWLLVMGSWPSQTINHKNGNKLDNRFENLEDVSVAENNRHAHRTGLIKTDRPRHRGRWIA